MAKKKESEALTKLSISSIEDIKPATRRAS